MGVFTRTAIQTSDGQASMSMQGNCKAITRNTNTGSDCESAKAQSNRLSCRDGAPL